ncbi:MAG TPA: flagellar biosynthesis anti-sigma factor FlgM [Terracidiphilus sp.]|jgi:flagellar biosynthesis anti-sigma factor FlgM
MRIDLYNSLASQIASESTPGKVNSGDVKSADSSAPEDRTTLTSGSASIQALVSEAMNTRPIRTDKVVALQHAISSGEYKLDPEAIAGSMIDEHA